MAIEPEEKTGMLGCLAALAAIGAVIGGVVWFSQQDFTQDPEPQASQRSGTALTHVDPVREKRVVKSAATAGPTSVRVSTDDRQDETARAAGVTAAVQNLGSLSTDPPPEVTPEIVAVTERVLASEPLCYDGRIARRGPSLFTRSGFAITYGTDTYNEGDPLPRLEIFLDTVNGAVTASYLSMTHNRLRDFPDHEVPVEYGEDPLSEVIAKWIAAVATETCPDAVPGRTPGKASGADVKGGPALLD